MSSSENLKAPSDSVCSQSSSAQADRRSSDKAGGAYFVTMGNDPAVLFYTADFLAGTMTMDDQHVGMYIRLLCLQHQKGILTKKDMLYICKTYVEDVFCKFVQDEAGNYYNKRLQQETLKRKDYCESRRKNRLSKSTYVRHMENENENRNRNISRDINEIRGYFKELGFEGLTDSFYDHFQSNGWKVSGRAPMKDWKAAARNWVRNSHKFKKSETNKERIKRQLEEIDYDKRGFSGRDSFIRGSLPQDGI